MIKSSYRCGQRVLTQMLSGIITKYRLIGLHLHPPGFIPPARQARRPSYWCRLINDISTTRSIIFTSPTPIKNWFQLAHIHLVWTICQIILFWSLVLSSFLTCIKDIACPRSKMSTPFSTWTHFSFVKTRHLSRLLVSANASVTSDR